MFINTSMLFYDCLIPTIEYSTIRTSKKAAAAVYAAIQILDTDKLTKLSKPEQFIRWSPTLEYYSGYSEADIFLLAFQMIDVVLKALRRVRVTGKMEGVTNKFYGTARHGGLLKKDEFKLENFENSVKYMEKMTRSLKQRL